MEFAQKILAVSQECFNTIDKLDTDKIETLPLFGIEIRICSFLPYHRTYKACDIITKKEIEIMGEIVHAILVPKFNPMKLEPWGEGISNMFLISNKDTCA